MKHLLIVASSVILLVLFSNDVGDDDLDSSGELASNVPEFLFSFAVLSQGALLVRMKDSSMLPLIKEDDIVVGDRKPPFQDGKIYIVSILHERRRIRKVTKTKDGFTLTPKNSEFAEEKVLKKSVRQLVRVVGAITGENHRKIT